MPKIEYSFTQALRILERDHPELHLHVRDQTIAESDAIATIGYDDDGIRVGEMFDNRMDDEQRTFALAFVACLIRMDAINRIGTKDPRTWTMACNVVAHAELRSIGLRPTFGGYDVGLLDMPRFDGMEVSDVYRKLLAENMDTVQTITMMLDEEVARR